MMALPLRLVLVLVGTGLYLLLPIWGWGGPAAFFAHPALTALTIVVLVITVIALFAGGGVSPGVREDRGNRWVLPAVTLLGIAVGFVPAYTDRLDVWSIDGDAIRWFGVAALAAGGLLRIWPVFVLGNRFSGLVAIQPGHTLVTDGVYGTIRHPSYLGLLLFMFGWSLAFRSLAGVLLTLVTAGVIVARIRAEERLLLSQFGAEYEAYRARTARLIPGIY
jgi:protein-S-isoprenylcysteine O-methyltransferase Ste14